jgi:hypothetical protein
MSTRRRSAVWPARYGTPTLEVLEKRDLPAAALPVPTVTAPVLAASSKATLGDSDDARYSIGPLPGKAAASSFIPVRQALTGEQLAAAYMAAFVLGPHRNVPMASDVPLAPRREFGFASLNPASGTARMGTPAAPGDAAPAAEHEDLPTADDRGQAGEREVAGGQEGSSPPSLASLLPLPQLAGPLAERALTDLSAVKDRAEEFFARLERLAGDLEESPGGRLARLLLTTLAVTGAVEGSCWLLRRLRPQPPCSQSQRRPLRGEELSG